MRMIVPPVAHRREIDRNLAEFFRGHRAAHFNRAVSSMCRYFKRAPPAHRMVRVHRLGQDRRPHLRRRPHPSRASRKLETRTRLLQRTQMDPDALPRDGPLPALERPRAQGRFVFAPDGDRASESPPAGVQRARAPALESRARAAPQIASASAARVFRSHENRDGLLASRHGASPLANPGGSPDAAEANRRKSLVGRDHLQETQARQVRNRDAAVAGRDGLLRGRARLRSGSRQGRSHRQQPAHRARGRIRRRAIGRTSR